MPVAYKTMRIVRCSRFGAASIIRATSSGLKTTGNFRGIFGEDHVIIGNIPPLQELF
jgi:hypothetical protein